MEISKDLLQKLFDVAVGSMNFGSGSLDQEEVEACREAAVLLGLDPMVGTPDNHRGNFPHEHSLIANGSPIKADRALRCEFCSYREPDLSEPVPPVLRAVACVDLEYGNQNVQLECKHFYNNYYTSNTSKPRPAKGQLVECEMCRMILEENRKR